MILFRRQESDRWHCFVFNYEIEHQAISLTPYASPHVLCDQDIILWVHDPATSSNEVSKVASNLELLDVIGAPELHFGAI